MAQISIILAIKPYDLNLIHKLYIVQGENSYPQVVDMHAFALHLCICVNMHKCIKNK